MWISILLNGYNRVLHKRLKSPENRAFKEWRFQREPSLFYFREKYETGCCMRFSGYCMQVYAFAYSLDRLAYSREVYAYSRDGLAYSKKGLRTAEYRPAYSTDVLYAVKKQSKRS